MKPYLDSILSESDWIGFVVRFGLNYLTQKRFGPERKRGEREERETERERERETNEGTDKQTTKDSGQQSD